MRRAELRERAPIRRAFCPTLICTNIKEGDRTLQREKYIESEVRKVNCCAGFANVFAFLVVDAVFFFTGGL